MLTGHIVDYPRTYRSITELPSVATVIRDVLPRLIAGDNPTLAGLRAQLRRTTVDSVEMTGVGFHAELVVPPEEPVVQPSRLVGGGAEIMLSGVEHGAGCLLFVTGGRLSSLEGFTYGGEEWRPDSVVLAVGRISPLAVQHGVAADGLRPAAERRDAIQTDDHDDDK